MTGRLFRSSRATARLSAFLVVVGISTQLAFGGGATTADYFCPKYEADLQFNGDRVVKRFGPEFPDGGRTTYTRTGNTSLSLTECSVSGNLFCVEERVLSGTRQGTDEFIYAIPRVVTTGDQYQVRRMHFRVERYPEYPGVAPSAVIIAEGDTETQRSVRYKMYVEQGIGVRQIYFDTLHANPPHAPEASVEFKGVSCSLVSRKGLFPDVRVHVTPAPNVVDY